MIIFPFFVRKMIDYLVQYVISSQDSLLCLIYLGRIRIPTYSMFKIVSELAKIFFKNNIITKWQSSLK